jgi:formate dehydrogenase maturation protein FdhE
LIAIFGRWRFYNSNAYPESDKDMAGIPISDKRTISYDELFIQYLTDMMLEVKRMKVKTMTNDIEGIKKHAEKIKTTLLAMMNADFERSVICNNFSN